MRFTAMRLVLSALTFIALAAMPTTLSADAIRLPSEDDRLAKDLLKKHPSPGRHLGWFNKPATGKSKPDQRPGRDARNHRPGPDADGGRLIDREPNLTPIATPEPGTLALLATGIGAAAVRSWRRRHKG